ncbi:helix-turn-helix transcriptional regulator [Salinibacterium sp. ZJ70]|uniref:helix-turn-helix transcriptional regulator n=1 Tax=Salinibacterium sp. ZJ70 TaxID=2708084 RepID=UPI0014216251|nr:helix-turn-helix transcriptional regulator [Salinibacterium sp. ZJ70]
MDREQLAQFLRSRREALHPEDVGLPPGVRRRTPGLRREEVAQLAMMSTDYLHRLEQARGPQPSPQILTSLSRALRLDADAIDYLFRLAGHPAPERGAGSTQVPTSMLRILDRLADTPAQIMSDLGETLVQTPPAKALLGDADSLRDFDRITVYRWFTDPRSREIYPAEDRAGHGHVFVSELRAASARPGSQARAAHVVQSLLESSTEFADLWAAHEVTEKHPRTKRLVHPELGTMTLDCQTLVDTETGQRLLVFTAAPGSPDAEKLALLTVLGTQSFRTT